MANKKNQGRWWDFGWQLVEGCTRVSPGCDNCWSLAKEKRFKIGKEVKVQPERLTRPLKRKSPASFSVWNDLFHPDVPFEFIDKVFAVMALCPQHKFQLLSKRHERRREYMSGKRWGDIALRMLADFVNHPGYEKIHILAKQMIPENQKIGDIDVEDLAHRWPLPNVHQLSTICNQEEADKFIPILLQTPAAVRGLSIEPCLSRVEIEEKYLADCSTCGNHGSTALFGDKPGSGNSLCTQACVKRGEKPNLDWIVIGCESGPKRRPCNPDWMIDLVGQCKAAGVACFVKQVNVGGKVLGIKDMALWPRELQGVQEFPIGEQK